MDIATGRPGRGVGSEEGGFTLYFLFPCDSDFTQCILLGYDFRGVVL